MAALQPIRRLVSSALVVVALLAALGPAVASPAVAASSTDALLFGLLAAPASLPPAAPTPQFGLNWTAWQSLGGTITSAPAAVSWGRDRVTVFARGGSGEIIQTYKEGAAPWSPWRTPDELRGVILRSAPSCTSWTAGTINCVALREGYGGVFQFYWEGSAWATGELGGDATSAPAIVAWGAGRMSVFVRNSNGNLIHRYWQHNVTDWVPPRWEAVGSGTITSAPACGSRGTGIIDCFALGPNGVVQQLYYDEGAGARWVGWNQLVGMATFRGASTISAVGWNRNLLDLFVRGPDLRLYQITYTGSWAQPWTPIEDRPLVSAPACTRVEPGRLDCFAQILDPQSQSASAFNLAPGMAYRNAQRR
ncbi:MAG: hypothetical protein HXY37_00015 [Chloroflexi bacterium]|nr:hypothetical protein [Chloroflexota bacterium]